MYVVRCNELYGIVLGYGKEVRENCLLRTNIVVLYLDIIVLTEKLFELFRNRVGFSEIAA